jgi:hypothetical protein
MGETEVEIQAFHVEVEAQSIKGSERIEYGTDGILFTAAIVVNGHLVNFDDGGYAQITADPFVTIRLVNVRDDTFEALNMRPQDDWMDAKDKRESFSLPVSSLTIRETELVYRERDSFMPLPI